jgi:hypothetical protein
LIAVLVAGFAFAGTLTGSASISFGADLDAKTFGFKNAQAWEYSFTFELDSTKVEVGDHQTELWAEIAAEASATIAVSKSAKASDVLTPSYSVKITKANIHVNDFTFGILNMGKGPDYAKAYYKVGGSYASVLMGPNEFAPGFTVEYKGYKAGFGIDGSWTDEKVLLKTAGWAETKAFTFGENDEISAQAGAYAQYFNTVLLDGKKFAGIALKGGYKADKLTASAAADLQIQRISGENKFAYEVAANAAYTINENGSAGLDVYMVKVPAAEKLQLDAQLWAKYNFKFDEVTLATTATVDARNILADAREITVKATEDLTILDGKLALSFGETYKIFAKTLTLTAKATYTAEKFTAWAAINDASMSFADGFALTALKPEVGISTTAIIENAKLSCVWTGANFVKAEDAKKVGSITAKAEISF